jgi:sodium/proline symporter
MNSGQAVLYATFAAYFLLVCYIGWIAWRRTGNLADYILGGRRLGRWTAALSAGASDMSGWLLLGLPGYTYLAGMEAIWIAAGLLAGTWLNWMLLAPRLRNQSESMGNALTLPEYFEYRFNDRQHILRFTAAFFTLLFFLFYTSSGLVAGGKLFAAVFGMPYQWAVIAGAAAILAYTTFGGFLAVSWTDLLQGLLMVLALSVTAIMGLQQTGWFITDTGSHHAIDPVLLDPFKDINGQELSVIAWLSLVGWGLGYFGQPHILVRFMAIKSVTMISASRRIAVSWSGLSMTAAIITGLTGIALLQQPLTGADSEKVFIEMVQLMFHPVIAGICLAAILAAIMSTADSQLLVASSAITEDFYKTLAATPPEGRTLLNTGRITVAVIAVIATVLALDPDRKVLNLVSYAWAGFGAAFGPALLLSLYWKTMTRTGALAGIFSGGLTVIIWSRIDGGIFDLYELVPGFIISTLAIFIFNRIPGLSRPQHS